MLNDSDSAWDGQGVLDRPPTASLACGHFTDTTAYRIWVEQLVGFQALPAIARHAALAVAHAADAEGRCTLSVPSILRWTGYRHYQSILAALAELETFGLVSVKRASGRSSQFEVQFPMGRVSDDRLIAGLVEQAIAAPTPAAPAVVTPALPAGGQGDHGRLPQGSPLSVPQGSTSTPAAPAVVTPAVGVWVEPEPLRQAQGSKKKGPHTPKENNYYLSTVLPAATARDAGGQADGLADTGPGSGGDGRASQGEDVSIGNGLVRRGDLICYGDRWRVDLAAVDILVGTGQYAGLVTKAEGRALAEMIVRGWVADKVEPQSASRMLTAHLSGELRKRLVGDRRMDRALATPIPAPGTAMSSGGRFGRRSQEDLDRATLERIRRESRAMPPIPPLRRSTFLDDEGTAAPALAIDAINDGTDRRRSAPRYAS